MIAGSRGRKEIDASPVNPSWEAARSGCISIYGVRWGWNLAQLQTSPQLFPKLLHSWLGSPVLDLGVGASVPSETWLPKETNVL